MYGAHCKLTKICINAVVNTFVCCKSRTLGTYAMIEISAREALPTPLGRFKRKNTYPRRSAWVFFVVSDFGRGRGWGIEVGMIGVTLLIYAPRTEDMHCPLKVCPAHLTLCPALSDSDINTIKPSRS